MNRQQPPLDTLSEGRTCPIVLSLLTMEAGLKSEGADESPATTARYIVRRSDMSDEMQKKAVEVAQKALSEKSEKDVAIAIKKEFDAAFPNSMWHCIVGKQFGASVAHATKHSIFLQIAHLNVLLFKSED